MPKELRKRDGSVVAFSSEKITRALARAFIETGEGDMEVARELTAMVEERLARIEKEAKNYIPEVEEIQDFVELALIEKGLAKTAKSYILYREEHRRLREAQRE